MKTTATWILAGIFGGLAVVLAQTNHLSPSIWFGVISIALLVISLFVHNQESKNKLTNKKEDRIMDENDTTTIIAPNSVFSVNQQGGITAGTVINANTLHMASPARRITPEQLAIILPALKSLCSIKIRISYAIGDREQKQFAEDIINAFRSAGCNPEVPPPPIALISPYGKGLSFGVNITPPYPNGTGSLQQALNNINIASEWHGFPDIPRDMLIVHVGERP